MRFKDSGNMHDRREAVIAGLTAIDMVIRVYSLVANLSPHDLNRTVCNHLVGIHVGLGA